MKDRLAIAADVTARVTDILGPPVEREEKYFQLIASVDDHLFIWNDREQNIVAVNLSGRGEDDRVQTLILSDCPVHSVTGLTVSNRGQRICVYGEEGVTAIEIPRRSGTEGRLGGGDSEILCRTVNVYRSGKDGSVQMSSWYPGGAADNQLIILTRDGTLALYLVLDHGARLINHITLGGGDKVSAALGETAVDYCVGQAVEQEEGDLCWPVFILWADGTVFCVETGPAQKNWTARGPIQVYPEQEENYSQESCSIVSIGDSGSTTFVAVARVDGTILHHIILADPTSGALSLHLYEKVELDLGPLSSGGHDCVFQCAVSLISDVSCTVRYLILHNAGLHQVCLPYVSMNAEEILEEQTDISCSVEHLICTLPTRESRPSPLLGATVSYPPATIISLKSDHTLHTLKARSNLEHSQGLTCQEDDSQDNIVDSTNTNNIEHRIRAILSRSCTQPQILSGADSVCSPAQTLHLVSTATETLQTEYLNKIAKAQSELAAEVKMLRNKKCSQEQQMLKLEHTRAQLRANAENISERYEDIRDKGSSLGSRVEAVLSRLQTQVIGSSHAELKMSRDLKLLQSKLEQIKVATEQLKEKEKYQRYQLNLANQGIEKQCSLSKQQTDNLKSVLQADSQVITNLVKTISSAKKDVTL